MKTELNGNVGSNVIPGSSDDDDENIGTPSLPKNNLLESCGVCFGNSFFRSSKCCGGGPSFERVPNEEEGGTSSALPVNGITRKQQSPDSQNLLRRRKDLQSRFKYCAFTSREMDVLLRLHRLLSLSHRNNTNREEDDHDQEHDAHSCNNFTILDSDSDDDDDDFWTQHDNEDDGEEKEKLSFLMALASCAVQAAEEEHYRYHCTDDDDGHNYEITTDLLLDPEKDENDLNTLHPFVRQAKQNAVLSRRKKIHLFHVGHLENRPKLRRKRGMLPQGFGKRLVQSLGRQCWDYDVASERRFLDVLSVWLGRRSDDETINAVFELTRCRFVDSEASRRIIKEENQKEGTEVEEELANAYDLVNWCYRLAVAGYTLDRCQRNDNSSLLQEEDIVVTDFYPLLGSTEALVSSLINAVQEVEEQRNVMERTIRTLHYMNGEGTHIKKNYPSREESSKNTYTRSKGNINDKTTTKEMGNALVSKGVFAYWCKKYFPAMPSALSVFMSRVIFPSFRDSGERRPDEDGDAETNDHHTAMILTTKRIKPHLFPRLDQKGGESEFFTSPVSTLLFSMTCLSQRQFGKKWSRLYSTSSDGKSFHKLEHGITGYEGPTLLIVSAFVDNDTGSTATFGAYASTPWKIKSTNFFGNADCFLFQLYPSVKVLRALKDSAERFQYFYSSSSKSSNYSNGMQGIGFGGLPPRLSITKSLDKCYVSSRDSTFESGDLLSYPNQNTSLSTPETTSTKGSFFDMECLEIWGL